MRRGAFDLRMAFHPATLAAGNAAIGALASLTSAANALGTGPICQDSAVTALKVRARELTSLCEAGFLARVDGGYELRDVPRCYRAPRLPRPKAG